MIESLALIGVVWLIGFGVTCKVMSNLGGKNPNTIGDSFSGSWAIDLTLMILWPMFACVGIGFWIGELVWPTEIEV